MIEFLSQMPTDAKIFLTIAVLGLAAMLIALRSDLAVSSLTRRSQRRLFTGPAKNTLYELIDESRPSKNLTLRFDPDQTRQLLSVRQRGRN